jgi:hypothetical protein
MRYAVHRHGARRFSANVGGLAVNAGCRRSREWRLPPTSDFLKNGAGTNSLVLRRNVSGKSFG